jgi:hypothetical protein
MLVLSSGCAAHRSPTIAPERQLATDLDRIFDAPVMAQGR